MAITFDAATNGGSTSGTSLTLAHTCGASAAVIVAQVLASTNQVTGVTYNGVALTPIGTPLQNSSNNNWSSLWYLLSPAAGAHNVVVSAGASITLSCSAVSLNGVQALHANAQGTTQTLSVTTTVDNCWTVIGQGVNASPVTAGAGTTIRSETTTATGSWIGDGNGVKTPPGAVTLGAGNGTAWAGHIAAFAPPNQLGRMFSVF